MKKYYLSPKIEEVRFDSINVLFDSNEGEWDVEGVQENILS